MIMFHISHQNHMLWPLDGSDDGSQHRLLGLPELPLRA